MANCCIRIDKPTHRRVIIPAIEVVESRLLVVDVSAVPQGVQLRQCTGHGKDVTPGVVGILRSTAAISTFQTHHIPLKVRDVVVDRAIAGHGQRHAVGIVAEIQNVVPNGHPHQLVTGIDVAVGLVVAYPSGAQTAGVVLHLPVPRIQLHRGDPGTAHVTMRIGDEAAVLRAFALCRHLHPQGGRSLSGQVLKISGAGSAAQPLIAQVCTFRFHDEGSGIAGSAIVIIRLVDEGELRVKLAEGGDTAGNRQSACLRG